MRRMLIVALLIAAPMVNQAAWIERQPGKSGDVGKEYGPVSEEAQPGIAQYHNTRAADWFGNGRKAAFKLMYDACDGAYRIVKEGSATKTLSVDTPTGGLPVLPGDSVSSDVDSVEIVSLYFECVQKSTETATATDGTK